MSVKVIGGKDKYVGEYINTTTQAKSWSQGLSPMYVGPVHLYENYNAFNIENAWQYSKLYSEFADSNGNPTKKYFDWANAGWQSRWANRYPMGKGKIPLCSVWNGEFLNYIEARKRIYVPLYAKAVVKSVAYPLLEQIYREKGSLVLWDFDGYDYQSLGMTFDDVLNNEKRKMGHAFVLAMLLEGKITVSGENVEIRE